MTEAENKSEFPRVFSMQSCPKNGSVVTVIHEGQDKQVYWVKDSRFGKDGGAYFDGKDYYKPSSFSGWRA